MGHQEFSREEIFDLVWKKPTTVLAKELGISDSALGKLCKKHQVPKPPRGYWAAIKADKKKRKPALKAYISEFENSVGIKSRRPSGKNLHNEVFLSEMQYRYFKMALKVLEDYGRTPDDCNLTYNSIRKIDPDLAAQILVIIQNRFTKWLPNDASSRKFQGAVYCVSKLVEKLTPLARKQIIILKQRKEGGYEDRNSPTLLLHVTPELTQLVSEQYHLNQNHKLSSTTRELTNLTHAWSIRHLYSISDFSSPTSKLNVSLTDFWISSSWNGLWENRPFETEKIPLNQILPTPLFPRNFKKQLTTVRCNNDRPINTRIEALVMAERLFDDLTNSRPYAEGALNHDYLGIIETLWTGKSEGGPFSVALQENRNFESTLNALENAIELEQARLSEDILGIAVGDNISVRLKDRIVRICLEHTSTNISDEEVRFYLSGRRYRKDGLLGKIGEYFTIFVQRRPSSK